MTTIEINPKSTPTHSIIWMHGLGADANDFTPIVSELGLPADTGIRFVFPNAPFMPVTINNGYRMRAWYDIYGVGVSDKIDEAGIQTSVASIQEMIENEQRIGIESKNIILAGFSQGAVIALMTGLFYPAPLAGILALSGYLPLPEKTLLAANPTNRTTPIFVGHGLNDVVVPFALGKMTAEVLQKAGYPTSLHSYPMEHSVCQQEITDIGQWIKRLTKQQ